MFQGWEWIVVLVVALLLFGKRLPEVMRAMGQGIREFKKGMSEDTGESRADKTAQKELPKSDSGASPPAG